MKVVNIPGGGGLVGANELMASAPNGLTIGDVNSAGIVSSVITHQAGLRFNPSQVNWLGQPNDGPFVMVARSKSPYHSLKSALAAHGHKTPIRMLVPGLGSEEATTSVVQLKVLGIPFRILAAYSDTKTENAGFIRGDGDLMSASYSAVFPLIKGHEATVLWQEGLTPWSGLPQVPTAIQVAQKEGVKGSQLVLLKAVSGMLTLGKSFAAPPGVPAARLATLRNALKTAIANPVFQTQAKKAHLFPAYTSPASLKQRIARALSEKSTIRKLLSTKG